MTNISDRRCTRRDTLRCSNITQYNNLEKGKIDYILYGTVYVSSDCERTNCDSENHYSEEILIHNDSVSPMLHRLFYKWFPFRLFYTAALLSINRDIWNINTCKKIFCSCCDHSKKYKYTVTPISADSNDNIEYICRRTEWFENVVEYEKFSTSNISRLWKRYNPFNYFYYTFTGTCDIGDYCRLGRDLANSVSQ